MITSYHVTVDDVIFRDGPKISISQKIKSKSRALQDRARELPC